MCGALCGDTPGVSPHNTPHIEGIGPDRSAQACNAPHTRGGVGAEGGEDDAGQPPAQPSGSGSVPATRTRSAPGSTRAAIS